MRRSNWRHISHAAVGTQSGCARVSGCLVNRGPNIALSDRTVQTRARASGLTDASGPPLMVSAFEGNKAETKTMLRVIEVFMAAHGLPDVTVRPQPQPDSSRSRNIEANPAASSFNGGQGVLPVLSVEGALGSHATGGLSRRSRLRGPARPGLRVGWQLGGVRPGCSADGHPGYAAEHRGVADPSRPVVGSGFRSS